MEQVALSYDEMLDRIELQMREIGLADFETVGFKCGDIYVKTIVIPEGSYLISKWHKTTHPFVLSAGEIIIYTEDWGEEILTAPHIDITLAGTRRFAKALSKCLWTTFHVVKGETEEEIEDEVIIKRINPLLLEQEKES